MRYFALSLRIVMGAVAALWLCAAQPARAGGTGAPALQSFGKPFPVGGGGGQGGRSPAGPVGLVLGRPDPANPAPAGPGRGQDLAAAAGVEQRRTRASGTRHSAISGPGR